MKKSFRGIYFIISTISIGLMHLSFSFPKSARAPKALFVPVDSGRKAMVDSFISISAKKTIYDSLHLGLKGLSKQAFEYAKEGLDKLIKQGKLTNTSIISIIDFTEPSSKKRLFVLDLKHYKILFNTLVAHGRNSGRETATSFSNEAESFKSSPGFYITSETYQGKNGFSLKLEGQEKGINDNAYERGIVIHGANYVCQDYVNAQGFIGRSQGCPAVPLNVSTPVINTIKNGTCLFIYHPSYINRSSLLD